MFPIRDDNPTHRFSIVTYGLIGLNLLSWWGLQGLGRDPTLAASVCRWGAIPAELLATLPLGTEVPLGPGAVCALDTIGSGAWPSALSSMFMHGGWFHLLGNLWFLYVFGDNVEDTMGRGRFVVFYLVCGLAATAAQAFAHPESAVPMVGASGAIGGVMGGYAVLFPRVRVHVLLILVVFVSRIVLPAWVMLGYWFALQILGGLISPTATSGGGVAFWAHMGGFLAGVLLVLVFRRRRSTSRFP